MHWPVLVPHTLAIDVDIDILQQLLHIMVAPVPCPTIADDPCDGCQVLSEGVLFLDGVHWFGEDRFDEAAFSSSGEEV